MEWIFIFISARDLATLDGSATCISFDKFQCNGLITLELSPLSFYLKTQTSHHVSGLILPFFRLDVGVKLGETLQKGGDHSLGLCRLQHHEEMPQDGTWATRGR